MTDRFAAAARAAVTQLSPAHVEALARALETESSPGAVLAAVASPAYRESAEQVLAAVSADGYPRAAAAAHLWALADGYALGRSEQSVEGVCSGPSSSAVPTRATAQVLIDVVGDARRELVLATYSARRYAPLADALRAAVERGVAVTVVVETLAGAGGALQREEPAAAFVAVPGIQVWHWPVAKRSEQSSKMHAKLAIADRAVLFVTSANLTQSGVGKNIEAGLLVRGGTAPIRAAEHIFELQRAACSRGCEAFRFTSRFGYSAANCARWD